MIPVQLYDMFTCVCLIVQLDREQYLRDSCPVMLHCGMFTCVCLIVQRDREQYLRDSCPVMLHYGMFTCLVS